MRREEEKAEGRRHWMAGGGGPESWGDSPGGTQTDTPWDTPGRGGARGSCPGEEPALRPLIPTPDPRPRGEEGCCPSPIQRQRSLGRSTGPAPWGLREPGHTPPPRTAGPPPGCPGSARLFNTESSVQGAAMSTDRRERPRRPERQKARDRTPRPRLTKAPNPGAEQSPHKTEWIR